MAHLEAPEPPLPLGVIVVDHGSRRAESNRMLLEIAAWFQEQTAYEIVEPAHMELAEPSIATAFARCVQRGAQKIVVFPYFLLPGRHWEQDIPALTARAAEDYPEIPYLVTAPFGRHPLMLEIMQQRIQRCLAVSEGDSEACETCEFRTAPADHATGAADSPGGQPHCRLR
jgi:sirohydrochlorin ferrochelatase